MRLLLTTALLIAAPTLALAAPDAETLAPAFKGTIVSTYPDGRQGKLWLSEDGSYKATGRRGDPSNGHWRVKGDTVCLKQSRPIPVWFSFCTPKPTSSTWKAKAYTGEPITVQVVKGGRG